MTRRQCETCPWKKGADLSKIPHYRRGLHHKLAETIADPEAGYKPTSCLRMMSCHYSTEGNDIVCVGWAVHQLGVGNNISLRIAAMRDPRLQRIETVGPQHATFEDTLCQKKPRKR